MFLQYFTPQLYKRSRGVCVADVLSATSQHSSVDSMIDQLAESDHTIPTSAMRALTTTADTSTAAALQIVTTDHLSNRVFCIIQVDESKDQSYVQLHLPTAALEYIKTNYIEPLTQRAKMLERMLQQQQSEVILAKHMSELVYLSPVFIRTDVNETTSEHPVTCDTPNSNDGSTNSTHIDESIYPHIVFYIIPYSDKSDETITQDVLCGNRGKDKLTFVIRLPQHKSLPKSLSTDEVSIYFNTWLSELAGFKLDMFSLPDNW
jgi:hypothetical protein